MNSLKSINRIYQMHVFAVNINIDKLRIPSNWEFETKADLDADIDLDADVDFDLDVDIDLEINEPLNHDIVKMFSEYFFSIICSGEKK